MLLASGGRKAVSVAGAAAKARGMLLSQAQRRSFLATSTAKPAPAVAVGGGGGVPEPGLADSAYRGRRLTLSVAAAAAAAAAAVAATVYDPAGSSPENGVSASVMNEGEALMPQPPLTKDMSAWSRGEVEAFVSALGRAVGEEHVTTDDST